MKQNTITTLHRTIAYVLLTSQLLTSCGFHETILPNKEQPPQEIIGLSDDNPIAEPPIAYTSTLATVSDQGYAANDISQSFEIHNYTTREGHKIRLIEDGDHYVAQVEENLPTGFSSRLPLLPVHSQQGLYLKNLTSFTYVEVVLPRQANDNKGYVVCVRQLGLLGGMPPSKADPNCDYKAHEYKQNINGDWVCPSGQHTVSAPPASSSSSGSGYPPNKDFNDFVRKERERDAARKRNWDAQRDADMWNRLNNPRHSHNESGFWHSAPMQTCTIPLSDFEQEVKDETERRIRYNQRLHERHVRGDYDDYRSSSVTGGDFKSTDYNAVVRDLRERQEREKRERERLDREREERERERQDREKQDREREERERRANECGMREKGEELTPEQERIGKIDRDLKLYYHDKLKNLHISERELQHVLECVISNLIELDKLGFSNQLSEECKRLLEQRGGASYQELVRKERERKEKQEREAQAAKEKQEKEKKEAQEKEKASASSSGSKPDVPDEAEQEKPKKKVDNIVQEVNEYLESHRNGCASKAEGRDILSRVEALKKETKKSYRTIDSLIDDEVPTSAAVLREQLAQHHKDLNQLRDLRKQLKEACKFTKEELASCKVRVEQKEDMGLQTDSSDEDNMSREDRAFNKGAIKGIGAGIIAALKGSAEGLYHLATSPVATVEGIVEFLENIDDVPGLIAAYLEELEEADDEKRGEEIAKFITEQVLTFYNPVNKAKLLQQVSKTKLGMAAVKLAKKTPKSKAISSFENQIIKHEAKLVEYMKDPMKFDNKGFLKNAPSEEVRQKIIQSRIKHLHKEIQTFRDNIQIIINT